MQMLVKNTIRKKIAMGLEEHKIFLVILQLPATSSGVINNCCLHSAAFTNNISTLKMAVHRNNQNCSGVVYFHEVYVSNDVTVMKHILAER